MWCIVALLLLGVVSFLDAALSNEGLDAKFESLMSSVLIHDEKPWRQTLNRVTRQAPKPKCCRNVKSPPTMKAKVTFLECLSDTKPKDMKDDLNKNQVKRLLCIFDCVGKKYDLVDAEGYLVTDKFLPYLKDNTATEELFTEKEEFVERCVKFSNKFAKVSIYGFGSCKAERGLVEFFGHQCNMAAMVFTQCIKGFGELNCPGDLKVQSAECDNYRGKLQEFMDIMKV